MKKGLFGVDVGGTTIKMGLFSTTGELIEKWEIRTDIEGEGRHILPDIAAAIQKKCHEKGWTASDVLGIGIGVPGPVTSDGTVLKCINLGWGVFSVASVLEGLTGIPSYAGNDATVAALGETIAGGGFGCKNSVMATLGTGVGGGIVIDGNIVYGVTGAGGEIGHIHVCDDEDTPCGCGNFGCLEQYASATGFLRMAKRLLWESDEPSLMRNIPHDQLTAKDVFDCAKAHDPLADRAVSICCEYLGRALAIIANIVNPELFIIGGGVSKAGQILIEKTEPVFQKYAFHACRQTKFVLASLGNDAGIYGAAHLVLSSQK
ncbi:MAG: ROK family glucokinase [Lachnospiraceae bacterium]|nr:ROK family glucokinase [Lachnospiraceae bacterium]